MKELRPLANLVKARKEKGWTQEALAKKAKVSRPMLSNIERGDVSPSLANAYRIAKALDSTIEHIFFRNNARKMNNTA
jgi:putative transcriptional regulator